MMNLKLKPILIRIIVVIRIIFNILKNRPYKLTFMVVQGCNLHCRMCSIWGAKSYFIDLNKFEEMIQCFPGTLAWINLSGGEFTLHPHALELLKTINKLKSNILVTITSNGFIGLSDELKDFFLKQNLNYYYYTVSLDGPEEVHDHIRGVKGAYQQALRTLEELKQIASVSSYFKPGVAFTLVQENKDLALAFVKKLIKNYTNVNINIEQASDYYLNTAHSKRLRMQPDENLEFIKSMIQSLPLLSADTFIKVVFLNLNLVRGKQRFTLPCKSIENHLLISADGFRRDCTLIYDKISEEAIPRRISQNYGQDNDLVLKKIKMRNCENTCYTPCEKYVHIINSVFRPRFFALYLYWYGRFVILKLFYSMR